MSRNASLRCVVCDAPLSSGDEPYPTTEDDEPLCSTCSDETSPCSDGGATTVDFRPTYCVPISGTPDGGDRVPDLSPREALERWLARQRSSKAESTVSSYYYRLKHFVEWCEEHQVESLAALNGWDIESYETARRNEGLSALTLNHELGTLQRFLRYCARVELVDETLPEKVAPPDVPKEARTDDTRLHPDDARVLIAYYRQSPSDRASRAHVLLELAWYTGARSGALRGLDLRDYDSDDEFVRFVHRPDEETPLKNGPDGERIVGLPATVCNFVDEYLNGTRHPVFDDYGREPLLASQVGRPHDSAIRSWMYLATVPCLHSACPHGNDPETCDYLDYSKASQCPSSRSPHQVRTGSITWQLNRGIPIDVVSNRVNSSARIIEAHYDKPSQMEAMEQRRRQHLDRLGFDSDGGARE